ncbi:MAG TPA: hypothetical protein VD931_07060 [Baekduia sp.]|nr:hypothetical protein [Baekduia sp.]
MASARPITAAALAAAALGLAACGGSGDDEAKPLGPQLGGSVAPLADCGDWRGGGKDRKLATIEDIRNQVNRTDTHVTSPPLSDEEAMQLFDGECKRSYARGFRLYVLYARAAGFAPLLREESPFRR